MPYLCILYPFNHFNLTPIWRPLMNTTLAQLENQDLINYFNPFNDDGIDYEPAHFVCPNCEGPINNYEHARVGVCAACYGE